MRLKTPVVQVGKVALGGTNPIRIQSMTNTDTADAKATVSQIIELAKAGSELVRITVDNENAAKAVSEIRKQLDKKGYKNIPLIGDFHFNGHSLLNRFPACASALDKYRINPGNVGHDQNFETIIEIAKKNNKSVRIGSNAGSVKVCSGRRRGANFVPGAPIFSKVFSKTTSPLIKAVVDSALNSAIRAEKFGLSRNQIILSVKMSDVQETVTAYRLLVKQMEKSRHIYALHLGLTEAGSGRQGIVASTAALSILLNEGIGDTIRVSLTPDKNSRMGRTEEVLVCKDILQSLGLRQFSPRIISCPGCGRAANDLFQKIALEVKSHLLKHSAKYSKNPAFANLKIAIMACLVNGPGEASQADIALVLPGKNDLARSTKSIHSPGGQRTELQSEPHKALVYLKGKLVKTLSGKNINKEFLKILERHIAI
ncbi:MAG: flavodoxin-dependent (E)-4-hydroxy-3-methylbut-2-enyl-diphosphate synthase [Candidatus Gracilibacteria bacterium]|jgi:(E)-4-hydroxy-3-methylbut-2-enyl-diphosphate synthase